MPEGDTILRIRNRLAGALAGQQLAVSTPDRRGRAVVLERLDGQVLERVDARGKHLLLWFDELVLHSHLGMSGSWRLYRDGQQWDRPRDRAWVVLSGNGYDAAQFGGPTLRLLRRSRIGLDPLLARLGDDILAPDFTPERAMRALRRGDQRRTLGEALLDQQLMAGIGNIFKCESCFAVRLSPWRALAEVSDAELCGVLGAAHEQMLAAVTDGRQQFAVYGRRGPCVRCGAPVRRRGQGDANRTTWWCEGCQH